MSSPVMDFGLGRGSGVRDVLIGDDDHAIREMLQTALVDDGYAIDTVADGDEVLAALYNGRYRLLILDLVMPGVDGFAVLQALRAEPALRPPAIIVVSALGQDADVAAALEAGADDYITKPFGVADLLLRVRLWLRRSHPSDMPREPGLRVHSLGRFHVEQGGELRLQANGRARKAAMLFKYLLTHEGRITAADEVCALLWPDLPQDLAATDLRSLLYQLRKLLGVAAHGPTPLQHAGSTLSLRLGPNDWWDVAEFRAWLAEGTRWRRAGNKDRALDALSASVALYAGDYLREDAYADWARPLREQLRGEWLRALEMMAELHGERGEREEREHILRAVLRADAFREHVYRDLMRLLVEQGRSAEALVLYRDLEQLLRVELDAPPDLETQAVAREIRRPLSLL